MIIRCQEYYDEVVKRAEEMNDKTLQECLERLKRWEQRDNTEIYLYKDCDPLSFYFEMYRNGKRVMNGGVIYHGKPDQSHSFTMNPEIGWQTHT